MPGFIRHRGKPLRNPRSGRLLKGPGGNIVAPNSPGNEQPPPVQTEWPSSPHLRLASAHGHVRILGQNGRLANVRLVTPSYPYTHLFTVTIHNTGAVPAKQMYWGNQYGGLFQTWGGSSFGAMGTTREVTSAHWGTYPNQIFAELSDGSVLWLDVVITIADTATGEVKPAEQPVYPRQDVFFEDFLPNTGAGALWLTFGEPVNDGNSVLVLDGAKTAMMPPHPDKLNTPEHGLGEGLFEFKCRYLGGRGDGTGPANVLWPADDIWPSIDEQRLGEIDLGEFWETKNSLGFWEMYMALHWKNAAGQNDDDLYNVIAEGDTIQRHNPEEWNIYGADVRSTHVDLFINGRRIVRYTARGAPDWAHGGVNRTLGIMNASSNTRFECDWVRWTPAHKITAGHPGTVPYALPIPGPSLPGQPEPPPPGDPNAEVLAAQTFLSGLSIGVNVERGRAWTMQYGGQSLKDSMEYYQNLRAAGFTHVRFFYPYRPTVNMSDGVWGTNRPTAAQIDRLVDACVTAVRAGMKVFVDALDIIGTEDLTATYLPVLRAHIDLFCDRIALRPELTPAKIAVGPVNEWASANQPGDNALYNARRVEFDTRIAAKLPSHVRVTGSAGYTSKERLLDTDWAAPTANRRWIAQFHAYETSNGTAAFWQQWAAQFAIFSQRHGGNPVFCGEAGLWSATDGSYRPAEWIANIANYANGAPLTRPCYWAITDSANGFMLNASGSDPTIRPALSQAFANADTAVRGAAGFITGSDKPTTPPPGPVNEGEPTWDGATQVLYHSFPGTQLDRNLWPIIYGGQGNGGVFDWDASCLIVNNGLTIETKYVNGRWKCGGISMGNTKYPGYPGFFAPTQVSFRARVDAGQGYGIGLILWPADDVWTQEIDVAESPDADKQRVWMTVHGNPPKTVQDSQPHAVDMTQWHIYTMRWEAGSIQFFVDGQHVRTVSGSQFMPTKNMTIGIQSWVAADNDPWFGGGPVLPPPNPAATKAINGVYRGNQASDVRSFESWIGRPVEGVLAYSADNGGFRGDGTFDYDIPDPGWQANMGEYLGGTGRPLLWTIPMLAQEATVAQYRQVADGLHNERFKAWARTVIAHRDLIEPGGNAPIYVRTTWELGGEWYPWTQISEQDPATFVAAWRQFGQAFKSVSPRIRMVWDYVPDRDPQEHLYPGDDVVDVISQDVYWQWQYWGTDPVAAFNRSKSGHARGLDWMAGFAAAHGKPMAISEWGVPGHNGNTMDGSTWIRLMRQWIESNNVVYSSYWDGDVAYDGLLSDGDPPGTAATLRELFQTGYGGSVTGGAPNTSMTKRIQVSYVRRLVK